MNNKTLRYALLAAASLLASAPSAVKAAANDSTLVADFELQTNKNLIDGFWFYQDDKGSGGNSKIVSGDTTVNPVIFSAASFGEPSSGIVGYSGKMEYDMGTIKPSCGAGCTYSNEVTFGCNLEPMVGTIPLDITGATAISFWAKATPATKISIIFLTKDITDYSWARAEVPVTAAWAHYTVNLSGTTGLYFKATYGQAKDKPLTLSKLVDLNFAIQKDSNPGLTHGTFLIDNLVINGWKSPLAGVRDVARSSLSRALRTAADGKSLRFSVPAAYRNVPGTVAAMDLSGKMVAKAAFAKGQSDVSLNLKGAAASTVFLRVFTGAEAF